MWNMLKKFGLQHCDLPTTLGNVAFLLRPMALNIDSRNKTPIPWYVYLACLIIASGYFYVYLISIAWYLVVWYPKNGDLLVALIVFSLGTSSEIGTVKLVLMFVFVTKVRQIVTDTLASDESVVQGSRFSNNILKVMRDVKKRALVFWCVMIFNGVAYIFKPILTPGRHLMEDELLLLGLEPMFETPNYQISFLVMMTGVIFTCYLPANITTFLIVINGYVEAQMVALAEEVLNLWKDAKKHYYKVREDDNDFNGEDEYLKWKIIHEYVDKHLKDIIKNHSCNMGLLREVEDVFRGAIALEFILLMMGITAELLGGLENTYIEMPFALMQVGMDCFIGQRVIDASVQFERAIYECKWENFDKENMKKVHIMLLSSQKTMKLSAGGILVLSFSTLMLVNRSIYSAYTTLRTTMK